MAKISKMVMDIEEKSAWLLYEYRDCTGTETLYETKGEAIEAGETLWATLSRHDRERYIKDPDGCIYVAEVPIVWDYDDEEYVVANYDCSPIWSAF